ncbi:hypothetical protein ANANG_G00061630 [Anguilla anguilla]|uniref:Uncharacterized protein n=1 Tax=Anguilla anguilla TaxID=7936 RepID=A0A9D3MPD9_ANGAN|nr:hypothetical protein ANANG_G00061630 [Anguilla anguilla]
MNQYFWGECRIFELASLFPLPGCRYVARKIRAAVRGEEQPEKPIKSACSASKAWKGEGSRREHSVQDPMFEPKPEGAAPAQSVEECRS